MPWFYYSGTAFPFVAVVGYCDDEVTPHAHAVTVSGSQALLNCTAPSAHSHVTWMRPGDGLLVSHDSSVSSGNGYRYRVIGDHSRGQYNLMVRTAQFPLDNGTWICSVFNGPRVKVDLTVLVPPGDPEPQVSKLLTNKPV